MKNIIYLDHAATTPVNPKVLEAMLPYFSEKFGNPSSIYSLAQEAREAIENTRIGISDVLGCKPTEIICTSGGTESDNTAIRGSAFALRERGNHIITSAIEHHAVLHTCQALEKLGFNVTYLPVDHYGVVDLNELEKALNEKTILVTIMLANNEVGTIQPIREISKLVKEYARLKNIQINLHTDAVQGAGALDIDVDMLGVDMLSISAHKFYGPKGVGILYLRRATPFMQYQTGGSQERNRRAGTENVAGIVGMGYALKLAVENRDSNNQHFIKLRDKFIKGTLSTIPGSYLNGHPLNRLPNNANFSFEYIEGESILLHLDFKGVAASSGSACASSSLEPSHVLSAMGVPVQIAHGSVRFTFGINNTEADADYVLSIMPGIINQLRAMSPLAQAIGGKGNTNV